MKSSELEKQLLAKELVIIRNKLAKIGGDLTAVFEPYGIIKGEHKQEFIDFMLSTIITANEPYYGGYTTKFDIAAHAKIPESLQQAILKTTVQCFMQQIEEITDIIDNLEIC